MTQPQDASPICSIIYTLNNSASPVPCLTLFLLNVLWNFIGFGILILHIITHWRVPDVNTLTSRYLSMPQIWMPNEAVCPLSGSINVWFGEGLVKRHQVQRQVGSNCALLQWFSKELQKVLSKTEFLKSFKSLRVTVTISPSFALQSKKVF